MAYFNMESKNDYYLFFTLLFFLPIYCMCLPFIFHFTIYVIDGQSSANTYYKTTKLNSSTHITF